MNSYHIHINGIVQGVGFRPFVYQLASRMQLSGNVSNGSDGVHIFFNASANDAKKIFETVLSQAPARSTIIKSTLHREKKMNFQGFSINFEEGDSNKKQVLLAPDISICPDCKNELGDKRNRRYRYPFITCTQCGPRYSIVDSLPFERHATAMQPFIQCKSCKAEYDTVSDLRFFSQTNSCGECGMKLRLYANATSPLSNQTEPILKHVKAALGLGKIVAVKGIGGYLVLCDANNPATIRLLRTRKHRLTKPFAILLPDMETTRNNFELSNSEADLLLSPAAPIILLQPTQTALLNLAVQNIAPGLNRLGVMLPYSPLLQLIAGDFGRPLIATSGNISGSPIIYKDADALNWLFEIADYIVSYNREIVIPQDDSVVQVSKYTQQPIILRRSRGYAPSFLQYQPVKNTTVLATGAFLKSSFTLSVNGNVFVSQFLGSGQSYESQEMYKATLAHWLNLYAAKPAVIITDKHPNYFSHQYACELAGYYEAETRFVQHHEAHFASVLAENNLLHSTEPVLGVVWDGTGLGDDGNLWGGEFFKYENNEMLRCYHFDYFPAIAGDKLALEPRIAALCATSESWPPSDQLKNKFTDSEWNSYQSLAANTRLFSSSVGRLFDAVASLLNICDKQTYEGEAAMYVQVLAESWVKKNGFVMNASYFTEDAHYYRIPTASLMQGITMDIRKEKPKDYIAAKFHYSLVTVIGIVAKHTGVSHLSFSGGVFQNALLVDWIQKEHSGRYHLFFHKNLSPNDENISFGQLVHHDNDVTTKIIKPNHQPELLSNTS